MPDQIPFDYLGAKKAGYSDDEIKNHLKTEFNFDFDIIGARNSGYSDKEISDYIYASPVKKKVGGNGSGYGVNPFVYGAETPSPTQLQSQKENKWVKAPGLKQEQPTNEFGAIENVLVENKTAGDRLRKAKNYSTMQSASPGAVPINQDFNNEYIAEETVYKNQQEDAKNAVLKANKEKIIKPVQDLVKSGEYKQFINDSGVFDSGKAIAYFDDYVKKRGGGNYSRDMMVATMKQAAEMEHDRPEFEKLLNEEYKKQGIDVNKYGQSLFDKQVAPKINSLENMKLEAKQKASEYFEQIKPLAQEIGGQYEQQVAQLNEAYKNGTIQEADANAQLKTINDDYLSKIKELDKNYSLNVKELNKKVSDKYNRINDEIKTIGDSITSDKVWASIPAEEKKKIQLAQEAAQGKLSANKNKVKELQDFATGVATGNPFTSLFTKSVMSGWNTGLADFGDYLSFKGFDNRMVRGLQGKRTKAEELSPAEYGWSENPFMRAITSSGTSLGASLPTTGAATAITLASGGAGLPGLVTTIAGGLTGYTLEKAQNTGGVYRDILEQTQDPSLAIAGAADFNEKQVKTLPLYFISAVGLQNLLKGGLKKTIVGAGQELTEELPTEYYQGFTQAQATQGYKGDFGQYIKENPQTTLDVIAGTLGQSGAISMASKTYQALFKKAPNPQVQFYADMIQKGGVNVAITNLQQQLDNDIITTEEYKNELAKVQQVVSTLGKVEELGLKGDNAKAFLTFSEEVKNLQSRAAAETDPAVRMLHEEKVKEAKTQLTEIAKGEGVYAVVTMPGGNDQTLIMPVESVTDSVIKKAEKVTIKNDPLANKDIQEKKKQLGIPEDAPDGMYKTHVPPIENDEVASQALNKVASTIGEGDNAITISDDVALNRAVETFGAEKVKQAIEESLPKELKENEDQLAAIENPTSGDKEFYAQQAKEIKAKHEKALQSLPTPKGNTSNVGGDVGDIERQLEQSSNFLKREREKAKEIKNEKEANDTKINSGYEINTSREQKKTNTIEGYEFTKSPTIEGVIVKPIDKSNNAIIEKQMFADENKNVLTNGVKYIGGGWYEIGGDNFGSVDLYNTVSKGGVSLNHKQGGRMGVVVQDFIKNNSRYNDNIAVRGSKFTQEEHNPKFGGSGHYKGTYFYVGLNAESKALEHGENLSKVDLEKANLYEIGVDGITSQTLKNEAKKAGYDTRDASGYAESEYLKKQGYDGIKRGNEVVLFEPKKFATDKATEHYKGVFNYLKGEALYRELEKNGIIKRVPC